MTKLISRLAIICILSICTTMIAHANDSVSMGGQPRAVTVNEAEIQIMRAKLKAMTSEERQRFVENMKNLSPQQKRDVEQRVREIVESE